MHAKCASFDSVDVAMASCHPVIDDNGLQKLFCDSNRCPLCHETKIRSRATLIITPPAILTQWQREISRHVDDRISTSIYYGVNKYVHPLTLADNDIVLTTFDTLMSELPHSFENPYVRHVGTDKEEGAIEYDARSLRSKKRYRVVPSPLIRIRWYRIVLDEAQRVESPTALSAKMALQLDAVHRWGVTGKCYFRNTATDK
jgi:E3 ubiquitin-protein ligase SHPRH